MAMVTPGDSALKVLRAPSDDASTTSQMDPRNPRSSSISTCGQETANSALPPYPLDPEAQQRVGRRAFAGSEGASNPLNRACSALAHYNAYLARSDERDRATFLENTWWLVEHEVAVNPEMGGWPVRAMSVRQPGQRTTSGIVVLSAQMQGLALSALQRAYQLTGDDRLRLCAARALRTFAHDILDGGIAAPFEADSLVFEDVGMYPATHALSGFLLGLVSLYDYGTMCNDPEHVALAQRGHNALHALLDAYDTGYWTRVDLLGSTLAAPNTQRHHARLLNMIAIYADCPVCRQTAERWVTYTRTPSKWIHAYASCARHEFRNALWHGAGSLAGLAPRRRTNTTHATVDSRFGVSVPITAYPVGGGMRAVLDGWRSAMSSDWNMEFLTAHVGPDVGDRVIFRFGGKSATYTPFQFPNVLAYVGAGFLGLRRLLRRRSLYSAILPQDGIYSAVFAGIAAQLAGIRLVVVDHGNIPDVFDPTFYAEQRESIAPRRGLRRWLGILRLALYMRTTRWLAKIGTQYSDHILAASDDVAYAYQRHLGVPSYRITRFPFMLDIARYDPLDDVTRRRLREELELPTDAIIVTMINRLHPMKGVDTGIVALERAVDALSAELRKRVYVLIAGDGQLRKQVAEQMQNSRLVGQSRLWGEATADEVAMLLKVSNIFLYPARRGINSMSVLEAMGAGCAVVATVTSPHIAEYLDEDRGFAVAVEDVDALAGGLVTLIADDERRRNMGQRARAYVMQHHTASAVRRYLLRATYWIPSFPESVATANRHTIQVTQDERDRTQ